MNRLWLCRSSPPFLCCAASHSAAEKPWDLTLSPLFADILQFFFVTFCQTLTAASKHLVCPVSLWRDVWAKQPQLCRRFQWQMLLPFFAVASGNGPTFTVALLNCETLLPQLQSKQSACVRVSHLYCFPLLFCSLSLYLLIANIFDMFNFLQLSLIKWFASQNSIFADRLQKCQIHFREKWS